MNDKAKIIVGGVVSLAIGVTTGVVGYLLRDSFDAPRLRVERVTYEVTREQCKISPSNLYRFRTAHSLRRYIETVVPWSLARDLQDDEIEYDHAENLLRILPERRDFVMKEIPFVRQQQEIIRAYVGNPDEAAEPAAKDAIAYVAGLKPDSDEAAESLQDLYARFKADPRAFSVGLLSSLQGRVQALEQEAEVTAAVGEEITVCYGKGTPTPLPMIGSDLSRMPNVEFLINISNQGRTDGQVSHAVIFKADAEEYTINLIGQNPQYKSPTDPSAWAPIESGSVDLLVYTIDRVRNEPERVRRFYGSLISESGISGTFTVVDIRSESYHYSARAMKPTN